MKLLRRLAHLLRRGRFDRELAEEIDAHRAMRQAALEARGVRPEDAAAESRRALGNLTLAREDARRVWIWPWLESVGQDLSYALRLLRRAPAFAAAIVIVMALGIGATTGVFALLDALVLKSLPVPSPQRLVYFSQPAFSYPIFREVSARGGSIFTSVSAWDMDRVSVQWHSELEATEVLMASGEFFATLGAQPAAGRLIGPDDDRAGGGPAGLVAVISHACWRQRFGGDPSIVGRSVTIQQRRFTIVGVTPPGFFGVAAGLAPEIVTPLTVLMSAASLQSHSSSSVHLLARLRDGVSLEQGNAALKTFWPTVLDVTTPTAMPAERRAMFLGRKTSLESARTGESRVRRQFEQPLWMLLALVTLLLTVASASAANLLLARGAARRRELAVRLAIGAGRARLVRQMLTETLLWTVLAAAAGVAFASWGAGALVAMMRTNAEPIVVDVSPNWRIFAFALGLAFVTAAVCALVPALRATRLDPAASIKGPAEPGGFLRRWSLGKSLVTAQVALTILLLAGGALFVRSLARVLAQDAGLERDRVLVIATDPMAAGYDGSRLIAFYDGLLDRLRGVPGVEAASLSWYPPISDEDGRWTQSIEVDGAVVPPRSQRYVHFNAISPDYFRTVGMRVTAGRDFGPQDAASAPRVAIVNERLVRAYFGGGNPIGRHITIGRSTSRRDLEIIAVVSDAKYRRLEESPLAIAYLPCAQLEETLQGANLFAEARVAGPMGPVSAALRGAVRAIDARVPVRVESVTDRIRESLVKERVIAFLASGLALTALALACAALYGLLAYAVARQTYEIGLRLALGAERRAVLWLVLRECITLAMAGTAAGLTAALLLGRYVRALVFEAVSTADPIALTAAGGIMLVVAALAGYLPARRAARVDPVIALRQQ
jgi:putative ABC transport system permease protein